MKRLTPDSTLWHRVPHSEITRSRAQGEGGQPWTILASTCPKKESQICILAEDGELLERRVRTTPRGLAEVLGERPVKAALPHAARGLDGERVGCGEPGWLGHEVIVTDPNFAPMYATRTRKVKTDRQLIFLRHGALKGHVRYVIEPHVLWPNNARHPR